MIGAIKSVCEVQTLEVMELSLQFLFKNYEPVLIVNGQEIVLEGHNGTLMERTLTKKCTMEDSRTEIHKENSAQGGIVSPEMAMKRREKEDNQELKERLVEADAQQKFEDSVICTNCKKSKGECNQQLGKRQIISKDEGKDAFMNYAFVVSNKGVQWNVIFMVLIVIFTVVKGTL